jgi:hypothetical protein
LWGNGVAVILFLSWNLAQILFSICSFFETGLELRWAREL